MRSLPHFSFSSMTSLNFSRRIHHKVAPGTAAETAVFFLEAAAWSLQDAVATYYEQGGGNVRWMLQQAQAQPPQAGRRAGMNWGVNWDGFRMSSEVASVDGQVVGKDVENMCWH